MQSTKPNQFLLLQEMLQCLRLHLHLLLHQEESSKMFAAAFLIYHQGGLQKSHLKYILECHRNHQRWMLYTWESLQCFWQYFQLLHIKCIQRYSKCDFILAELRNFLKNAVKANKLYSWIANMHLKYLIRNFKNFQNRKYNENKFLYQFEFSL